MSITSEALKAKYGNILAQQVEQDIDQANEEFKEVIEGILIDAIKTAFRNYKTGSVSISMDKSKAAAITEALKEDRAAHEDFSETFEHVSWRVEVRNAINQSPSLLNVHQVADRVLLQTGEPNANEDTKKWVRKKVSVVLSQLKEAKEFKRWEYKREGEFSGTLFYGSPEKFEGDEPLEKYKPKPQPISKEQLVRLKESPHYINGVPK